MRKFYICLFVTTFFWIFCMPESLGQMRQVFLDMGSTNNSFERISFYSPSSGYLASTGNGSPWVGYTTDTGRTFIKKNITLGNVNFNGYSVNLTFGFSIYGVHAFDQNRLLAYGDYGLVPAILSSTDGGNTFNLVFHSQYSPLTLRTGVTDLVFPQNGNIGYAVDADRILKTTNGGVSWSVIRIDEGRYFNHLVAPDANTIYAYSTDFNNNALFKSLNAGTSWQTVTLPNLADGILKYAYFLTAQTGWVYMYDNDQKHLLYKTTDGGVNWTQLNHHIANPFITTKMIFLDDNTGYALANQQNTVYKTSNGGQVWEPLSRDNNFAYLAYSHNDLFCLNATQLWACGNRNFLELSTNGGGAPKPMAYFLVDTSGYSSTGNVTLTNYSNSSHQFKWYVNNVQVSTNYHASYTHSTSSSLDSIKLVVTSTSGAKDSLTRYAYFYAPPDPLTLTGWKYLPTGINDNLKDVRFFGQKGVVIGSQGIYYTTGGAENPGRWKKYSIPSSSPDSAQLARTKFLQLASNDQSDVFFAIGNDTVQNKAILFRLNLIDSSYTFLYVGGSGSRFNSLTAMNSSTTPGKIVAVGSNGLILNHDIATGTNNSVFFGNDELQTVSCRSYSSSQLSIVRNDSIFLGTLGTSFSTFNIKPLGRHVSNFIGRVNTYDYFLADQYLYKANFSFNPFRLDSVKFFKPAQLRMQSFNTASDGANFFVGTDQGIYKGYATAAGIAFLEYQPTSLYKSINQVWFKQNTVYDTGYAVGNGGVLMKTMNFGGPAKPYASITGTVGSCLNGTTPISLQSGSATSCALYLNGNLINSNCTSGGQFFTSTAGTNQLMYVTYGMNGVNDTAYHTLQVTPKPPINLPVSISDTVLCHSESIQFLVQNTQSGFRYDLIEKTSGSIFGSALSNGTQVLINSIPISRSDSFYIRVTNPVSNCSADFTNRMFIKVEKTQSAFAADRENIATGETVSYYQRSIDASTFSWTFHDGASISNSTLANPADITYSNPGQKTLTLISTSAYGCKDTLTAPAVFVYVRPQPADNCFVKNIADIDYDYAPTSYPDIAKATILPNNDYLVAGYGNKPLLPSRYGNSVQMPYRMATYLIRYTENGAIRWAQTIDTLGKYSATTVDEAGNIYVTGYCDLRSWHYFNNGDSMRLAWAGSDTSLPSVASPNAFIMKLDANGNYLWHTVLDDPTGGNSGLLYWGAKTRNISYKNGYLYVSGGFEQKLYYYRNNIKTTLFEEAPGSATGDNRVFLLRIQPDGNLAWKVMGTFTNANTNNPEHINQDNNGNVFLVRDYENSVKFVDADSTLVASYTGNSANFRSILLKFDPTGHLAWQTHITSSNAISRSVKLYQVAIDEVGNSYITGIKSGARDNLVVTSANSLVHLTDTLTGFPILKFNPNGIYQWAVGCTNSYYGDGKSIQYKNGNLFTAGFISDNSQPGFTYNFNSTNNIPYNTPINSDEILILHYDTAGVFKKIGRSGQNTNGRLSGEQLKLALDQQNNFILTGVAFRGANVSSSFSVFGAPPMVTNDIDAYFAKINPNLCYPVTPPVANAGRDTSVCSGSSVVLGSPALPGYNYSWTSNPVGFTSSQPMPSVNPTTSMVYYLSVMDGNGVLGYDTVSVSILPQAQANAGSDTTICLGGTAQIGSPAISGTTYSWSSSPGTFISNLANPSVSPVINTMYFLEADNGSGCTPARDTVLVTIMPITTASVTIAASTTSICSGIPVTFTATPVNGGTAPSFQWLVNGINAGSNSPTFTSSTLANNDQVQVFMQSNATCTATSPVNSNIITITVSSTVTPSVSISTSATTSCQGTSVSFTATAVNGGSTPVYQWLVNGNPAGTNSDVFTSTTLQNNDQVSVSLTSSLGCASPTNATSNVISMTVTPTITPAVNISTASTSICEGSLVTITASVNNGGATPVYQWFRNGVPVVNNSPTLTASNFLNNEQISLTVTSTATCAVPATVNSNTITLTVNSIVTPAVSITASSTDICQGEMITFTATPINGGNNPVYQWKINGLNTGSNSPTFSTTTLNQGDIISVTMTSNALCISQPDAVSNQVTITVRPVVVPTIQISGTLTGGTVDVQSVITLGGTTPAYQWQDSTQSHTWNDIPGANNTNLLYTPASGTSKVRCLLQSSEPCAITDNVYSNILVFNIDSNIIRTSGRLYPNPAHVAITIDSLQLSDHWQSLELRGENGTLISTYNPTGQSRMILNVSHLPAGVYLIILRRPDGKPMIHKFVKY